MIFITSTVALGGTSGLISRAAEGFGESQTFLEIPGIHRSNLVPSGGKDLLRHGFRQRTRATCC